MHDFYQEYISSGQAGSAASANGIGRGRPFLEWLLRRVTLPGRDALVIDAGCGSGRLVWLMQANGFTNVAGVDVSKEQIEAGRAAGIPGLVHGDAIEFLEASAPGSVDAVFALDLLEHFELTDALRFLRAVRRCLRDQGQLVLHVPNGESPFVSAVRYSDITHTRAFTRRSLEQILFPSGLQLEWIEEGRPIVHGLLSLMRRIIWTIGRSAFALFFLAETGAAPEALSQNITALARPRLD